MAFRPIEGLLLRILRVAHLFDHRHPNPMELGTPAIKRILAISSTAVGDTLLSTPALRSLRLAYPDARLSLLIKPEHIGLFHGHPRVDELIPFRGGWLGFIWLIPVLRRCRFDLACILHGNEPQATPLAYLSGARFRFKLPNANRFRFLLTNTQPVFEWKDFQHGIDQRLAVAKLAHGATTDQRMELTVTDAAKQEVAGLLAQQGITADTPLLALQAGASTTSRRWAKARFAELARRLLASHPDLRVVLTGSPRERSLAESIATDIGDSRVWNAAGKLPLASLPALIERCSTMVTGDTGPMHLAITVGTPVVALFAVSDSRRSGPAYDLDRHIVIQKWRTCDPCLSKKCPYAEPICMDNISVDEVEVAVATILDHKAAQ